MTEPSFAPPAQTRLPGLDLWDEMNDPPPREVRILDVIHRMYDFNQDRTNNQERRVLHLRALHVLEGRLVLVEKRVIHDSLIFAALGSSERTFANPLLAWNAMEAVAARNTKFAFTDTRPQPCSPEVAELLGEAAGAPALSYRHDALDNEHQTFFNVEQWAVGMKLRTLEGKAYWDWLD
ncbi:MULTISPECIES: UTRA domain-containing protein [unclassified Caulobacter]|uniref:UTRA domain-containing protein n=1 Tax=unclassified Caulobacter TaxID=2648921 RepID=UPI0013048F64|nr:MULTISPECIES: UTRA domain-containing protein [unclassified Caulobacter]